MTIVLTRIDSRLIHGQVVQGWLPSLKVQEVVVVSPVAFESNLMCKMMRMSLPKEYTLQILSPHQAASYLKSCEERKILLLVEDFDSLFKLLEAGVKLSEVTIGNTKYEEGKKQYSQGVFLSAEELSVIKQKAEAFSVNFVIRTLPTSLSTRLF